MNLKGEISVLRRSYILFFKNIYVWIVIFALINIYLTNMIFNVLSNDKMSKLSILDNNYRKMDLSGIDFGYLENAAAEAGIDKYDLLLTALYNDLDINENVTWDKNLVISMRNKLVSEYGDFTKMRRITQNLVEEIEYFPVAASTNNKPFVEYVDSWFLPRTYGGNRVHEGTDLMAGINESGLYPIVSVSDGIIEKIGWLEKGGYRVGVRSESGIYYYYAHLSDYGDICEGQSVKAGELLGFMGDTGYGPEGTTGMFDVHLHFGIYINDSAGNEVSLNPYWILLLKNNKVLYFDY